MISINTNLSAAIVKQSLNNSSLDLNKTLERLTTGFKINHASDNAANYSISNNYQSKLSSYDIASDNIAEGMDMMATAEDTLSLMEKLGSRLHALITQAQNGTYGDRSLETLNQEAAAIIAEIDRLYNSAEYNGIKLFSTAGESPVQELPKWVDDLTAELNPANHGGFISNPKTKSDSYVNTLQHVSEVSTFEKNKEYQVSTKEDLQKLAQLVNSNVDTTNVTFYMGADIDLNGINWTPIGNKSANSNYEFKGTFDGNGHVVKNFSINSNKNYAGLFGYTNGSATIKNLGVENANVKGVDFTALLVGSSDGNIVNCYAKGSVEGREKFGALAGNVTKDITDSYTDATVKGIKYGGVLVGYATKSINRCFVQGSITLNGDYAAGIAGCTDGKIENCYSNANIKGKNIVGGIAGRTADTIINSYATGTAEGYEFVGGVAGIIKKTEGSLNLNNILSLGQVTAVQKSGALLGGIENTSKTSSPYYFANVTITNGYVTEQELPKLGGAFTTAYGNAPVPYDTTEWLNNITYVQDVKPSKKDISLQVGIHNNLNSKIFVNTGFEYDLSYLLEEGIQGDNAYSVVNSFLQTVTSHATSIGAVYNQLESALDTVSTHVTNLTSSLSTIKDSDIDKISSKYVQQQILQQASATLFAAANQSPSIALQLI